jgi:hypothetical protein
VQWRDRPFEPGQREKLALFERRLRRWVPVLVLVSLPTVWQAWRDQGETSGLLLLAALVAVELSAGLYLPWVFRRILRDGDAASARAR